MEAEQKVNYLREIAVFRGLSKADMQEMDRTTTMSPCRWGKIFYRPEDASEVLL